MNEKSQRLSSSNFQTFSLEQEDLKPSLCPAKWRNVFSVVIFTLANLCLVINHLSVAPVIGRVKEAFHVDDSQIGLLQSCYEFVFVASMLFFGYLGDRWKRLIIVSAGLLVSSTFGAISSLVPNSSFTVFVVSRSITALGESAYTAIIPSLIGDTFVGASRTAALTCYLLTNPLGLGIGTIAAGAVSTFTNNWRWAFRLTPFPLFILAICFLLLLHETQRGEAENTVNRYGRTTFKEDLKYLISIPTFVLALCAHVSHAFSVNAQSCWAPDYFHRANAVKPGSYTDSESDQIVGSVLILVGIFGVAAVIFLANRFGKPKLGSASDGLVAGFCMLAMAPTNFIAYYCVKDFRFISWIGLAVSTAAFGSCFVFLKEITLSVVVATRRSTGEAVQAVAAHLLGDAVSPYFIGLISDQLRTNYYTGAVSVEMASYLALQGSLHLTSLVVAACGGFFLLASLCVNNDNNRMKKNNDT